MKRILLISLLSLFYTLATAQGGTWTWVKGSNAVNDHGNNGTIGISNSANYPEGRYQSVNWIDLNGNFWIFGGLDNSVSPRNDLWKYDPLTNIWTWVNGSLATNIWGSYGTQGVPSPNNIPGARGYGVASWTDKQGRLWLHGGSGIDETGHFGRLDDLWMYDIPTNQWTWMKGSNSLLTTFTTYGTLQVPYVDNTPGGRDESNTAWVKSDGTLWTFGGSEYGNLFNDVWKFDITTNEWTWMSGGNIPTSDFGILGVESISNLPLARSTYTSWQDANDNLYIFAGGADYGKYNDVWKYNTTNNQWTWIAGSSSPNAPGNYTQKCVAGGNASPSARIENRTAQLFGCTNVFCTFGGINYLDQACNDLWYFNTQNNEWTWVSGSSTGNDLGSYGIINVPSSSNMPPSRFGVSMWVQPTGTLWVWGGMDSLNNRFSDMWKFEPDTNCINSVKYITPLSAKLSDSSICKGDAAFLTITGGHVVSVLPEATAHLVDSANITFTPATSTSYTVIASGFCGVDDTFHFLITVSPPPKANFVLEDSIFLVNQAIPVQYSSSDYDTIYTILNGQPISPIPNYLTINPAGTNCLTLFATKYNGCVDTLQKCFYILALAIPSAFTPNSDNLNETFYPIYLNKQNTEITSFRIYNRWGQLVHDNPQHGWDGRKQGNQQPSENYTYFLTVRAEDIANPGQIKEFKKMGTFTLLR